MLFLLRPIVSFLWTCVYDESSRNVNSAVTDGSNLAYQQAWAIYSWSLTSRTAIVTQSVFCLTSRKKHVLNVHKIAMSSKRSMAQMLKWWSVTMCKFTTLPYPPPIHHSVFVPITNRDCSFFCFGFFFLAFFAPLSPHAAFIYFSFFVCQCMCLLCFLCFLFLGGRGGLGDEWINGCFERIHNTLPYLTQWWRPAGCLETGIALGCHGNQCTWIAERTQTSLPLPQFEGSWIDTSAWPKGETGREETCPVCIPQCFCEGVTSVYTPLQDKEKDTWTTKDKTVKEGWVSIQMLIT